jgi:hypothetical protein
MSGGERWQRETATAFPHTTEIHDIFSYRPPKRLRIPSRGSNRGIHKVATSVSLMAYRRGAMECRASRARPTTRQSRPRRHCDRRGHCSHLRRVRMLRPAACPGHRSAARRRRELAEPARRPRDVRSVSRGSSIYRAVNALVCGAFMTCCVGPRFRLRENCFISDAEAFHCLRR